MGLRHGLTPGLRRVCRLAAVLWMLGGIGAALGSFGGIWGRLGDSSLFLTAAAVMLSLVIYLELRSAHFTRAFALGYSIRDIDDEVRIPEPRRHLTVVDDPAVVSLSE